jgi:hypothetical protein
MPSPRPSCVLILDPESSHKHTWVLGASFHLSVYSSPRALATAWCWPSARGYRLGKRTCRRGASWACNGGASPCIRTAATVVLERHYVALAALLSDRTRQPALSTLALHNIRTASATASLDTACSRVRWKSASTRPHSREACPALEVR